MAIEDPSELWEAYWADPTDNHRNDLMMHYLELVEREAWSVHRRVRRTVSVPELVSAGAEGLMQAIARFDRGRNVRFSTYAPARIRGAMLDWLRSIDRLSRKARQEHREAELSEPRSLEETIVEGNRIVVLGHVLADDRPVHEQARAHTRDVFRFLLRGCSDRDRLVLLLYYHEGATMKEIGDAVDLSESRVSQLVSRLLTRLRRRALLYRGDDSKEVA